MNLTSWRVRFRIYGCKNGITMSSEPKDARYVDLEDTIKTELNNGSTKMSEMEVSPVTILPHDVIEKLAELDLELSEG